MDSVFLITINVISAIILIAYVIHGVGKRKRLKAIKAAETTKAASTESAQIE